MEKDYILNPVEASWGRTLWENLVVSSRNRLDSEDERFRMVSSVEEMKATGMCVFDYLNVAKIEVIALNKLRIVAETQEKLNLAESKLKEICGYTGIPLIDD